MKRRSLQACFPVSPSFLRQPWKQSMEPFIHTGATSSITWIGGLGRGQPHPPKRMLSNSSELVFFTTAPGLPHCRHILYRLSHHGSPTVYSRNQTDNAFQTCPPLTSNWIMSKKFIPLCISASPSVKQKQEYTTGFFFC